MAGASREPERVARTLVAFGVLFVVAGHMMFGYPAGPNLAYDLFPTAAFGVMMLVFGTGYLLEGEEDAGLPRHLWDCVRRFLIPMLAAHALAGVLCAILVPLGFPAYGKAGLSPYNVFVSPFTHANMHEFGFDLGLWIVVPLLAAEVSYSLLRKVCAHGGDRVRAIIDVVLAAALTAGGIWVMDAFGSPEVGKAISETDWLRLAQTGTFLAFLPLGHVYRRHLEPLADRIPDALAIAVLVGIQIALMLNFPDKMGMNPCWMQFPAGGGLSMLMAACGTLLWLRISRVLAAGQRRGSLLSVVGRNAYAILAFHVLGFFLINLLFSTLAPAVGGPLFDGFSDESFRSVVRYGFVPAPLADAERAEAWGLVYLIAGVGVPVALGELWRLVSRIVRRAWARRHGEKGRTTGESGGTPGPVDKPRGGSGGTTPPTPKVRYPYGRITGASPSSVSRRPTPRRGRPRKR